MFQKLKILEIFQELNLRFFKIASFTNRLGKFVQFHSGGDDYCPLKECEGLGGQIGNTPSNGVVLAWRDSILRKSLPGEKRIYSILVDEETQEPILDDNQNMTVAAEICLKNDGSIIINNAAKDLNITVIGNVNLKAEKVNIDSTITNLGVEGKNIARLGDEITVEVTGGSSAGTYKGTITSAGVNTSI